MPHASNKKIITKIEISIYGEPHGLSRGRKSARETERGTHKDPQEENKDGGTNKRETDGRSGIGTSAVIVKGLGEARAENSKGEVCRQLHGVEAGRPTVVFVGSCIDDFVFLYLTALCRSLWTAPNSLSTISPILTPLVIVSDSRARSVVNIVDSERAE